MEDISSILHISSIILHSQGHRIPENSCSKESSEGFYGEFEVPPKCWTQQIGHEI